MELGKAAYFLSLVYHKGHNLGTTQRHRVGTGMGCSGEACISDLVFPFREGGEGVPPP